MINKQTFTIESISQRAILVDLSTKAENENAPLVIFVHGFKGFKDWGAHNLVASYFAERGFRFLKFNFSHNGTTPQHPEEFADLGAFGNNTFTKELSDLDQVITYASSGKDFSPPNTIHLIGHSRGGGIGIIQASEDKRVKKLVTWASVSRFRSLWMAEQEEQWRKNEIIYVDNARTNQKMPLGIALLEDIEKNPERLDILEAAGKINIPWLIMHGDNDKTVPVEQAYELNNRLRGGSMGQNKSDLLLIQNGDHVFGAKHPWDKEDLPEQLLEVCEASIRFLKDSG